MSPSASPALRPRFTLWAGLVLRLPFETPTIPRVTQYPHNLGRGAGSLGYNGGSGTVKD